MPEEHGYPKGKENHKVTDYKVKGGKKKTRQNKGESNASGFKHHKRTKY